MSAAEEIDEMMAELLRCRGWIEDALDFGGNTHDFEDIVKAVFSGHMQLWANERGCAVTEMVVFPKKKMLNVFLAGGDMDQILDMESACEEFAKMNDCDGLTIAGRKGWKKVLGQRGWTERLMVMERSFK